ncbi:MAG: hypothetical protein EPN48_18405 [Microbacteriaceae bacterium]|nr:MAG: hypothetical protein EPN48_18405 [Microbacteriaceae bacterium]
MVDATPSEDLNAPRRAATAAERKRTQRARARARGLCVECCDPHARPAPGRVTCPRCLRHARRRQERRAGQRAPLTRPCVQQTVALAAADPALRRALLAQLTRAGGVPWTVRRAAALERLVSFPKDAQRTIRAAAARGPRDVVLDPASPLYEQQLVAAVDAYATWSRVAERANTDPTARRCDG